MQFQTIDPTTNKVVKSFDEMDAATVDKLIAKAVSTFDEWKKTDYKTRSELLYRVAGLLRAKKNDLSKMIMQYW
jgi:succinate-semialdehyde dehydrogenase/glutarate-semialdehyde dehydrogenase